MGCAPRRGGQGKKVFDKPGGPVAADSRETSGQGVPSSNQPGSQELSRRKNKILRN